MLSTIKYLEMNVCPIFSIKPILKQKIREQNILINNGKKNNKTWLNNLNIIKMQSNASYYLRLQDFKFKLF